MKDIKTDEELVEVLDELKHRLKPGVSSSALCEAFNAVLNLFLARHGLDKDQHVFASMPEAARSKSELSDRCR